ncbi:MAG TPA: hypothetical protein VFR09_04040 [Alphaproteobacteria bacterium]|nr:hypothetical protein [Alphaproteobacteria bacterium]
MSLIESFRLPFGNGDEAEYLAALYGLQPSHLDAALNRVHTRRKWIFVSGYIGAIGIGRLSVPVEKTIPVVGAMMRAGSALTAFGTLSLILRNRMSLTLALRNELHRDFSVVIDAITNKTGNRPPELNKPFRRARPKRSLAPA